MKHLNVESTRIIRKIYDYMNDPEYAHTLGNPGKSLVSAGWKTDSDKLQRQPRVPDERFRPKAPNGIRMSLFSSTVL